MQPDSDAPDMDDRLDQLFDQAGEFLEKGLFRSALNVYGEVQRTAKRERKLEPYLRATFHQMDLNKDILEPRISAEKAIELIGLLESPDRAALIQSDYDAREYEQTVAWMSACSYENLADATGMREGYNSTGMHACIADGIEVCRRTGKLRCINCFREYASDVYSASEDMFMALHQSRTILNHQGGWSGRGNRHWVGARNAYWLELLVGKTESAEALLKQAEAGSQEEGVSLPIIAACRLQAERLAFDFLMGRGDLETPIACPFPAGENPLIEMRWAVAESMRHCCRQDWTSALTILSDWDRRLLQKQCISDWFDIRLRHLAVRRLAGQTEKQEALIEPLAEKARASRDWLTLHRLGAVLAPEIPATPFALMAAITVGPFAANAAPVAEPVSAPVETATTEKPDAEPAAPPPSPLEDQVQAFFDRLSDIGEESAPLYRQLVGDVLSVDPATITEAIDAGRLMHLLILLADHLTDGKRAWAWIERAAAAAPNHPAILSQKAELGDILRSAPDSPLQELIDPAELEKWHRESLDQDPFNPHSHARAGAFFLRANNLGEAERCFARGFRLLRTSSFIARNLADIYDRTDRPRDALAVLDLSLREGNEDPDLAWQAAVKAHQLEQFESMLTYLDQFEKSVPDFSWASYYRAIGCIETARSESALTALDTLEKLAPDNPLPTAGLRMVAYSQLERHEECRRELEKALAIPLVTVDSLTYTGLVALFARVWKAASTWPDNDPLVQRLGLRMVQAGMAPDAYFERYRKEEPVATDLMHYRVTLEQPLDLTWPEHPGCLHSEKEWRNYQIMWGLLAPSEEDAVARALSWQARVYPDQPATPVRCEELADNFEDSPGIVWMGQRWNETDESGEAFG